jgi:hypothetical protein
VKTIQVSIPRNPAQPPCPPCNESTAAPPCEPKITGLFWANRGRQTDPVVYKTPDGTLIGNIPLKERAAQFGQKPMEFEQKVHIESVIVGQPVPTRYPIDEDDDPYDPDDAENVRDWGAVAMLVGDTCGLPVEWLAVWRSGDTDGDTIPRAPQVRVNQGTNLLTVGSRPHREERQAYGTVGILADLMPPNVIAFGSLSVRARCNGVVYGPIFFIVNELGGCTKTPGSGACGC